jgi:hypothetical protein
MKKYKLETELQGLVYTFIVNFLTSRDEKSRLLKLFSSLDIDGDGKLSN